MTEGMADRFRERQEAERVDREQRQGPPPAADGRSPADPVTEQTQLLRRMADDVATVRKILVFFTFLWGLGVVVFLLTLLGRY